MSDPPRPEHVVTGVQQLQAWRERTFERLRFGRPARSPDASSETSLVPGVLVGAALALLGLVAIWGWQTWSGRVSVPIDDRLPMLISSGGVDEEPAGTSTETSTVVPVAVTATDLAEDELVELPAAAAPDRIVVHVAGAVLLPGVVTLPSGARVIDALDKAGGPNPEADLDRVNLAALVLDGERIHVPALGEDQPPVVVAPTRPANASAPTNASAGDASAVMLDINLATSEALEALPGVGPSIAQAIVQTRFDRGPFLSVDELLDVPGIGEAKLAQIEPHVRVG